MTPNLRLLAILLPATLAFGGPWARAEAPWQELRRDGHEMVLPQALAFAPGSPGLPTQSDSSLKLIRAFMARQPAMTLPRFEGHVSDGSNEHAQLVTCLKRSLSVTLWLVEHGVEYKRQIPVGRGSSKPRHPAGDVRSERMGFVNVLLRGSPTGGLPVYGGDMTLDRDC